MRLLLLSNSTQFGKGYLDHAESEIARLLEGRRSLLFVPFALHDQAGYALKASERLSRLGIEVSRLEEGSAAPEKVAEAEALFVGGGNTFRLLDRLQRSGVIGAIRRKVERGMPYLGASAGTVVAAPTIRTTNDMPIVQPASLDALGLVPFQINCHYLDADPASRHMGETREQRLKEFHEENDTMVVGLREGAMLSVTGTAGRLEAVLLGGSGARVFRKGHPPEEVAPGAALDHPPSPAK
ncbi:MAG TPA: dipeptidase PepE [Candidatus Polarisedimenticolia bacterium]|nr:dipeptidase PepE [Candidatus Polarisedimenticolia bacterium]